MTRQMLKSMALLPAVLLLLAPQTQAASGSRLPDEAEKVIEANFPGARITGVGRERERGAWYYEVNLRDGKRRFEVEITEEGVIGEIEARVEFRDIPPELQDEVRRRIGNGRLYRVEKHERRGIARSGKFVPLKEPRILYEIKYYTAAGERREVQLASNRVLELPQKVVDLLAEMYPRAKLREAEVEDDEGVLLFVVDLIGENGEHINVVIAADARVFEREVPVPRDQTPRAIVNYLRKELRSSDKVEIRRRETDAVVEDGEVVGRHEVTYSVLVRRGKLAREYRFDGRGKFVEKTDWGTEDDEDGDDDEDDD